jgi:hypothetical protein
MRWPLGALLLLAGCERCLAQPPPPKDVVASPDAASDAAPPKRAETTSLIPWTDSRVAVSSTVDNPKDYPEHLIDGKLETAWNGRTGDLGGFIAFRVPRAARVASVHLTAGFDKKDLFTANHRISRIKVMRDGVVLKEVALDVEKRGLQAIAIDQPGGDFELRVVATVQGTNAKWKELVVSELYVLGDPGSARRASPHLPRVRVGSLDAPESRFTADEDAGTDPGIGPWPSIASYCAAFETTARARAKKRGTDPSHPCAEIPPPSCAIEGRAPIAGATPFVSTAVLSKSDGYVHDRWVAVETDKGWWPHMIRIDGADECQLGDFATESGDVTATKAVGPSALAIEVERRIADPQYVDFDTGQPSMWVRDDGERVLHVCRADGGDVRCDEKHVLGTYSGRLVDKPAPFDTWKDRRAYRVDPADGGTILLR